MKKSNNKPNIVLSIVALALITVLAAGITYSWVEGGDRAYIESPEIFISTGSSLTMRQDGDTTDEIFIHGTDLFETSSADGRNFFFPLDSNSTNTQSKMTFREGTPADVDKKYLSVDFELEAGSSGTPVYLGAGTIVRCNNESVMNALRMCFNFNDGTTSKVFKPNQMPGTSSDTYYSPITAIDTDGMISATSETNTFAYGDYYYKGTTDSSSSLFTIQSGETKKITLTMWLEGTEIFSEYADASLGVYIEFTTQNDDLVKYNFVDNTHVRAENEYSTKSFWVSDTAEGGYETMMYIYDRVGDRYYAMTKQSGTELNTWTAYVPSSILDFYFRRYSIDIDEWWNQWEPDMGSDIKTDPNGYHTYIAICGQEESSGERLDGCYGYWQDEYDTIRVYFRNECAWNDLHCYAKMNDGTDSVSTGASPGTGMEQVAGNLYYIDLKYGSNIKEITFSNGNDATIIYIQNSPFGADATYGYMYYGTGNYFLGGWSGMKAVYDEGTGAYRVEAKVGTEGATRNAEFYFIANKGHNNDNSQKHSSNTGVIGKSYYYNCNDCKLYEKTDMSFKVADTQYIFNGALYYYKNTSTSGYKIHLASEDSLIYPFNDPTT